jgi:uncharacterized repeat protein (TIGR01451 family)
MKRQLIFVVVVFVFIAGALLTAGTAQAAQNKGTGDIAGNADISDSNIIDLTTSTLGLVKRAFLADGTPVVTGTSLPKGSIVKFMIYVNNNTSIPVSDVSVQDALAATFAYQAGTIKVDNSVANCAATVCTGAEETAIYAAVNAKTADTDAVDGDTVSYTAAGTTINAGNQHVANGQLDIAANRVWAVMFTVKMQ